MVKEYKKEDVFVVFDSEKCEHSGICVKGLPSVFCMNAKPWIQVDGANKKTIIDQVANCPSGALSIKQANE
jgi:uncharacterized Fe-S cluster protein YjdI